MHTFLDAVKKVTTDEAGLSLSESIKDPSLAWLLDSSACERCFTYLAPDADAEQLNPQSERYRAGGLLVVLAAMQVGTDEDALEALRLVAARRVDTRGAELKYRYKRAGEARRRPVSDARHYQRAGHVQRMQRRLADELYDLVTHPDILERALDANGATARAKYL